MAVISGDEAASAEEGLLTMRHRPTLSLLRMLALNAVVCGLEFCASAAFCYIPPLLLKAGIEEQSMTLVLAVGPALGFFLVPIIGRASDRCRSRLGRRRPFILALSVALVASLFVVGFGNSISETLMGETAMGHGMAVALLVIGAVVLDFACQACLTPCEALLSDVSHGTGQQDRCFTVYSLAISVGGCVGYLITALDWRGSPVGEYFGSQERSVFMLLAMLYLVSLIATIISVHEVPHVSDLDHPVSVTPSTNFDPGYVSDEVASDDMISEKVDAEVSPKARRGQRIRASTCPRVPFLQIKFLAGLLDYFSRLRLVALSRVLLFIPDSLKALFGVPLVLRRLAVANFCSWTAVMAFNLFYTDFTGQAVYKGNPYAEPDSELRELYDNGVRSGSWGLLFHCIASAVYAPVVEKLAERLGLKLSYMLGIVTFSVAMALMLFTSDIYMVNALATCTGLGYATMTTIPFMLVTEYHQKKEVYFSDTIVGSSLPSRGFGTDLSTLDSAYFLSQVILTVFMGSIVHFTGTVRAYVMCASLMGVIACFCISRIVCNESDMKAASKSVSRG